MRLIARLPTQCLNDGPPLPMLLCLNQAYKLVEFLSIPVFLFEQFTRNYLQFVRTT